MSTGWPAERLIAFGSNAVALSSETPSFGEKSVGHDGDALPPLDGHAHQQEHLRGVVGVGASVRTLRARGRAESVIRITQP